MSTSIIKVLFSSDDRWSVESNGERTAYACRSAAISAAVHRAIKEDALLMIYERDSDPDAPIDSRDVELVNQA